MLNTNMIERHRLIVNCLETKNSTLLEIENYLRANSSKGEQDAGAFSKRTFLRDKQEILNLYKIYIEYNRSTGKYEIINKGADEIDTRLLDNISITNVLRAAKTDGVNHIEIEKRGGEGLQNIHGILHALQHQLELVVDYQTFYEPNPKKRTLRPYLLKEFKHRWYLLAVDANKDPSILKSFGLDRIKNLDISKRKFKVDTTLNPKKKYKDVFGISTDEYSTPERVLLSFEPSQGKYVETLPIHHSQQTEKRGEDEWLISLRVHINYELLIEIKTHGSRVKVLEPKKLRQWLVDDLKENLKQYE